MTHPTRELATTQQPLVRLVRPLLGVVGRIGHVVHVVPVADLQVPDVWEAYCGSRYAPAQVEEITDVGVGVPCEPCVAGWLAAVGRPA